MTDFNEIVNRHAAAQLAVSQAATTKAVTPDSHRGWAITWDYGEFQATGPNYDASYEGEEDGWVDNGHRVFARTREDLIEEIDAWFEEHSS